jgi:hypothetical protein
LLGFFLVKVIFQTGKYAQAVTDATTAGGKAGVNGAPINQPMLPFAPLTKVNSGNFIITS